MAEDLSRFIASGGLLLLAAVVTAVIAGGTVVVACIAGLVVYSRPPGDHEPRASTGSAMRVVVLAIACLPAGFAVGAALVARHHMFAVLSLAENALAVVSVGIRGVLNSSMVLALVLVVLPPFVAAALVIWGPLRERAIDRWQARRLEREAEHGS